MTRRLTLALVTAACVPLICASCDDADRGSEVKFDQSVASSIDANFAECPTPLSVRTQPKGGDSAWWLWVSFQVRSSPDLQALLTQCVRGLPAYSERYWDRSVVTGPGGWGTGSYFQRVGPDASENGALKDQVEFLEVDAVTQSTPASGGLRYEGRAVQITRDARTDALMNLDVLMIRLDV